MIAHFSQTVSRKELRDFGLIFGGLTSIIFGGFLPWLFNFAYPIWPWYVLLVSGTLALLVPISLKYPYKIWMAVGAVLGWINTRIILGVVFYCVFTPYSLVLKLFRKDLLSLKLDSKVESYRIKSDVPERNNLENIY